jgi:hypothetical protein
VDGSENIADDRVQSVHPSPAAVAESELSESILSGRRQFDMLSGSAKADLDHKIADAVAKA